MNFSISKLSELTGKSQATVRKRLEAANLEPIMKGSAKTFDSKVALQAIYIGEGKAEYILEAERARLSYHQANKTRLEEEKLKGELIPADEVEQTWSNFVLSTRSKLLALPSKVSYLLIGQSEVAEIEETLSETIRDALEELSGVQH